MAKQDSIKKAIFRMKSTKIYDSRIKMLRGINWKKRDVEESASIFESRWELRRVEQVVE